MKVRRSTFARLRVGIDTAVLLAAVVGFTAFGVLIVHGVYMGWLI